MPQKFGFPSAEVPSQVAFGSFGVLEVSTTCCRCVGVPGGPRILEAAADDFVHNESFGRKKKSLGGTTTVNWIYRITINDEKFRSTKLVFQSV